MESNVGAGPHGGPGGLSPAKSSEEAFDDVDAGPRGGPGSLGSMTEPAPDPDAEER